MHGTLARFARSCVACGCCKGLCAARLRVHICMVHPLLGATRTCMLDTLECIYAWCTRLRTQQEPVCCTPWGAHMHGALARFPRLCFACGCDLLLCAARLWVHVCMEHVTRRTLESCFSMCPTRVRVRVHVCSLTIKQSLCHCLLWSGHTPPSNPNLEVCIEAELVEALHAEGVTREEVRATTHLRARATARVTGEG